MYQAKNALTANIGRMLGPLKVHLEFVGPMQVERELQKHAIAPKYMGRSIVAYNVIGIIRDIYVRKLLEDYDVAEMEFDRRNNAVSSKIIQTHTNARNGQHPGN